MNILFKSLLDEKIEMIKKELKEYEDAKLINTRMHEVFRIQELETTLITLKWVKIKYLECIENED